MFQFTRKPSSGSHSQYLVKITHLVQCEYIELVQDVSVLWLHIMTCEACVLCAANFGMWKPDGWYPSSIMHSLKELAQTTCLSMKLMIRVIAFWVRTLCIYLWHINHLTPNGHYMGRTSRCCILYIYSTNIRTEYFKHAA